MEIPIKYIFNLTDDHTLVVPDNLKIIFLCGVVFDSKSDDDKRIVLKDYLNSTAGNYPIILEEHFSDARVYGDIDLFNLYDVETLVACFANATIIIHESLSTSAELGMLASNKSTASKLLVLHPDTDSVEEDKISTFIRLAYYGKDPILSKDHAIPFNPSLKKAYKSNDRYTYHTIFPNKLSLESRARNGIDEFLKSPNVQPLPEIVFQEVKYNSPTSLTPHIVDYHKDDDALCMYMSSMALRDLLFSLLSLQTVRDHVEEAESISDVIGTLINDLQQVLIETARAKLGETPSRIEIRLKGIELSTFNDPSTSTVRKAVGLFVYLLKAMDYLADENNKKFKLKIKFNTVRDQFTSAMAVAKQSDFEKHLEKSGVE